MRKLGLFAAVVLVCLASQASAGDKVWSVPGVINNLLASGFSCTNGGTAAATVTVALFDATGAASGTGMASIAVNGTVNFVTKPITALPGATLVGSNPTLMPGSATITAPSGVFCTAFVSDPGSDPPTVMRSLPVIAKNKQRGD